MCERKRDSGVGQGSKEVKEGYTERNRKECEKMKGQIDGMF